jgi:transcriptional regulator with XRE-family HTH domain
MQRYPTLGMQLRLKRVETGLHQKTLGILLGGATQALISWWESGRYIPGDRYLGLINQFLALDPMALRVYVKAIGLQHRRRQGHKIKPSDEALTNGAEDAVHERSRAGAQSTGPVLLARLGGKEWKKNNQKINQINHHGNLS